MNESMWDNPVVVTYTVITGVFAVGGLLGAGVWGSEAVGRYGSKKDARIALGMAVSMLFAWAWPLMLTIFGGRFLARIYQLAEIDGPIDKWRARQAKKIEELEQERRADKARIKQLEAECEIKRDESAA